MGVSTFADLVPPFDVRLMRRGNVTEGYDLRSSLLVAQTALGNERACRGLVGLPLAPAAGSMYYKPYYKVISKKVVPHPHVVIFLEVRNLQKKH